MSSWGLRRIRRSVYHVNVAALTEFIEKEKLGDLDDGTLAMDGEGSRGAELESPTVVIDAPLPSTHG